jgi:xanthine dehydrogenase accessory factor
MNRHVRRTAQAWLEEERPAVVVVVLEARGSAPRGPGTRMLVSGGGRTVGTIGGGHLELEAIREAHALLSSGVAPHQVHYPLGPALGQCCGGAVTLGFNRLDARQLAVWPDPEPMFYLQLHGAGHVGSAIARILSTIDCLVDWVDEREEMFPFALFDGAPWPDHIRVVADDGVEDEVKAAPNGAYYLVLTHNHDLDLRITEAILKRGDFEFLGLIGSKTKRARFIHRFERRGIPSDRIARMTCPIGIEGIDGKEPEMIAIAVVAQLLQHQRQAASRPEAQSPAHHTASTCPTP